jgi:GIY-YIG catalytic domain
MPRNNHPESQPSQPATVEQASKAPNARGLPFEVEAIRKEISAFFKTIGDNGLAIGRNRFGVYAFYDYDGEPIYIGQTYKGLGDRISRHLTNRRTDAVAMGVLDPFEVAEIRVWPLDLSHLADDKDTSKVTDAQKEYLDRAEFTLFQKVIAESKLSAVLNEKPPPPKAAVDLPKYHSRCIIPESIYPHRKHPDVRIARRANTIAALARVISERRVSRGLRQTLLTQAKRLERLAEERLRDFPTELSDQEVD